MKRWWIILTLVVSASSAVHTQPASPNRVLELDGDGGCVERSSSIFNDLTEATVEMGWAGMISAADSGARSMTAPPWTCWAGTELEPVDQDD